MKKAIFVLASLFSFAVIPLSSCGSQTPSVTPSSEEGLYHTVKFKSNGGTEIPDQRVKHGEKATQPADPEKEGYSFTGWYYKGEKWSFAGYVVTEDMTLSAKYSIRDYRVSMYDFTLAGGWAECTNYNLYRTETIEYGKTVKLRAFPNEGYAFAGWYDDNTFLSDEVDYSLVVKKDLKIHATWRKGTDTLYGIEILTPSNGKGTITLSKDRASYGETITGKAVPYPGYTFSYLYADRLVHDESGLMWHTQTSFVNRDQDTYIHFTSGNYWGPVCFYAWNEKGQINQTWPGEELSSLGINFYQLNKGRTGDDRYTHFIINDAYYQTEDLLVADFEDYGEIDLTAASVSGETMYKAEGKSKRNFLGEDGSFSLKITASLQLRTWFNEAY